MDTREMDSSRVAPGSMSEDCHTCGSCKMEFRSISKFIEHKSSCTAAITCSSGDSTNVEILVLKTDGVLASSTLKDLNYPAVKVAPINETFQCGICNKLFKTSQTLKVHQAVHGEAKPFVCMYAGCNYSFKTKGSLVRHERRHTDERPFQCEKCQRRFRESGALTRHLKSQTPCTQKLDSDLPNYGRKHRLPNEELTDEPDEPITTDLFSEQPLLDLQHAVELDLPLEDPNANDEAVSVTQETSDSLDVDETINSQNGKDAKAKESAKKLTKKDFYTKCLVCPYTTNILAELKAHLKDHLTNGTFMCEQCPFITNSRSDLTAHATHAHSNTTDDSQKFMAEHADIEPDQLVGIERTNPDQTVREATKAIQQLMVLDNIPPDCDLDQPDLIPKIPLKSLKTCPLCDRMFRSNSYLKLHLRRHTGERPYKCKQCPKDFPTKDTFKKHMLAHTDERQYKCGECGKLFKRVSHAKEHLKIHTNERPFYCVDCRKYFRSSNSYKVHLRTHTDNLPWICKICDKRFREKASLTRHIRIHTGEKPFSCKHCGKTFSEHGTLNRHLKAKIPCSNSLAEEREQDASTNKRTMNNLIPVDYMNNTSTCSTVLTEFSSVVTDTQEYMPPQQVVGAIRSGNVAGESQMDTIEVIQEDGSVYIVRGNRAQQTNGQILEGGDGSTEVFEDQSGQYILLDASTAEQLQSLEDNSIQ